MFFGKYPPRGFHERPGARFLLPSDTLTGMPAGMLRSEFPSLGGDRNDPPPPPRPPTPVESPAPAHAGMPGLAPLSSDPDIAPALAKPWRRPEPSGPPVVPEAPDGRDRRQHARINLFVTFTLQQVAE